MTRTPAQPAEELGRLIGSFMISQALFAAATLRIADRLAEGEKSAACLAHETGAHPRALYRLLRALASAGVFVEREHETFALNPVAQLLRSDQPGTLRPWALMAGEDWIRRPWDGVLKSVSSNAPAFEHAMGERPFNYMSTHPRAAELLYDAMTQGTLGSLEDILHACDFSRFETIADIGGGNGVLIREILRAYPCALGILFELPAALPNARVLIEEAGLSERCALVTGNFFESVPLGADAYVLKWILHNWDDTRSLRLLENCRAAMNSDSRLLIVERLVPAPNTPSAATLLDLNMLVIHGGGERTESEYAALLQRAGLTVVSVKTGAGPLSVIEAKPATTGASKQ